MNEAHYTISSLQKRLQVITFGPVPPFEQWWGEAIVTAPEIKVEPLVSPGGWELVLKHDTERFEFSFLPDSKRVIYCGRPQFQEIGLLITSIFERMHAEDGAFTIHASAIQTPKGKGWIFFGESFSGKTTAIVQLQKRIRGLKYIGNERILISKDAKIIGGTVAVRVKGGNCSDTDNSRRRLYHFKDLFDERIHESDINKIIQINLHKGRDGAFIKEYSIKRSLFTIYGQLGEAIHNSYLLFDNMLQPGPSFNNLELSQKRVRLAHALVEKSPVIRFSGTIEDLLKYVLSEES